MEFKIHKIEWTAEKSARIWDYYSSNTNYRETFFGKQVGYLVAKYINKKLKLKRLENILDFSCGMGDIINELLPFLIPKHQIYATDFSEKNIEFVNKRFKENINFKGATLLQRLPSNLDSNMFDLILITEVVEHLTDDELSSTLKEAHRLLKKGGMVFITTPNNENYSANEIMCPDCGCIYHKWQHLRTWNKLQLESTVQKFGFEKFISTELNWMNNKEKILNIIKPRPKGGLLYVGKKF